MPKGYSVHNQGGWRHKPSSVQLMRGNRGSLANENNPRWRGMDVTYAALHNWVRNHFVKPKKCEECGVAPGFDSLGRTKLHWANLNKQYTRYRKHWMCMCAKCHKGYDLQLKVKHRYVNR